MRSVPTKGRTLDHAAFVYDWLEPLFFLGKHAEYDSAIIETLNPVDSERILDVGCGTGVLTKSIAEKVFSTGGSCIGIDAAANMIRIAQRKRQGQNCTFQVAAAESLPFSDGYFDCVVSSMFFHHVQLDLKLAALTESYRILKPGGRLVIADMHVPTTLMGKLVSHTARWFFLQPQIAENTRGVLPSLIETAGFACPSIVKTYLGYIAVFTTAKESI